MSPSEPAAERQPTAAMLVIGDEILTGRTRDANAHHLAGVLFEHGVRLSEIRVIGDEHEEIVSAVNALRARYDHVFTSGGIGPTHDDITADAVAAAFGASIDVREDARAILAAYYHAHGRELNPARLRMARIPDGAELIENPVSHAPGFRLGNVMVMAGVPAIFEAMVAGVVGALNGGPPTRTHSFRAMVAEGDVAAAVGAIDAHWQEASLGVYPFYLAGAGPGCTVVVRSSAPAALTGAADEVRALLAARTKGEVLETPPL